MVKLTQGNYFKAADINSGDIAVFKDEGYWETSDKYKYDDGNPKRRFLITADINGKTGLISLNKGSRDAIIGAYGDDTSGWVGKAAKITKEHSRQINADILWFEPAVIDAPVESEEAEEDWE